MKKFALLYLNIAKDIAATAIMPIRGDEADANRHEEQCRHAWIDGGQCQESVEEFRRHSDQCPHLSPVIA